jgi:hypothetical protein
VDLEHPAQCGIELRKPAEIFLQPGRLAAVFAQEDFVVDQLEDRVRVILEGGVGL